MVEQAPPVDADEFFAKNFPGQTRHSVHLKGLRCRARVYLADTDTKGELAPRRVCWMAAHQTGQHSPVY